LNIVPAPNASNGNHFQFIIPEIGLEECGEITIRFKVKCNTPLGTLLCSSVYTNQDSVCPLLAQVNYGNNPPWQQKDCRTVTGSFDPNDKGVQPAGAGQEHLIARDSTVHYLIRFQNTGTDTAFTVVVYDSLPGALDPATFRLEATSHPCVSEMYGLGVLRFRFDNILLPDSNINEQASHGFVKFSLKFRQNIPALTRAVNSAAIYFDYNAPVITNEVFHTIDRLWYSTPIDTSVCIGEAFFDAVIQTDTLVYDTLTFTENYLIINANVTALPVYEIHLDTTVQIGQQVAEVLVTQTEQIIKKIFQQEVTGCDSIIYWHVTGLSVSNVTEMSDQNLVKVSPNPGRSFIEICIDNPAVFDAPILFFSTSGQTIRVLPMSVAPGICRRIDVSSWIPGVYTGWSPATGSVFRFVKE